MKEETTNLRELAVTFQMVVNYPWTAFSGTEVGGEASIREIVDGQRALAGHMAVEDPASMR